MVRLYCEHADGATMERILEETEGRLREFVAREG
jgi:hypothetical protein